MEPPDFDGVLQALGLGDGAHARIARNMLDLNDEDAAQLAELTRRAREGTATPANLAALDAAHRALEHLPMLPPEARAPLGEARVPTSTDDDIERVTSMGVAPLIAARIARGSESDHIDTVALRAVRAFAHKRQSALVLIGERGCGKSFAAAWWLVHGHHVVPPTFPAKKLTRRRLLDCDIVGTLEQRELLEVADARALVVDDAGTEDERYYAERVATLLARRYRSGLLTVITTNLARRDFSLRYGNRITDRMDEIGEFVVCGNSAADSLRRRDP